MTRRWTRPSWFAWVLLVAGLALFVTLARWQLGRAAEKEQLLAAFAAAATTPTAALASLPPDLPVERYPHVSVKGHYLAGRSYLLDEQVHGGRVGRMALAVFVPADGSGRLIVNRGWFEARPGMTPAPLPALPEGEIELAGIYAPPPGGGLRVGGNALERQATWPKLTLFLDLDAVRADLGGGPLHPRILLLDADPASGLVREWTPAVMPPEKHRGYAFQWFSFALAAIVIFVVLHWRRNDKSEKDNPA
jgi:cytochrome oxidase assembly protein ShyY1